MCNGCQRLYHPSCVDQAGQSSETSLCPWCTRRVGSGGDSEPSPHISRFTPEHLPKSMSKLVEEMDKYIPYLPEATIDIPAYRYEGKKLMGKGPATEKIAFIMMLPCMVRDLASEDFVAALQCRW